jgi:hypothetical protein
VNHPCPNHSYRSRTIRDGKLEKFCVLCINQAAMRERWKNIRKALATIRCSTRKSSTAAKPVSAKQGFDGNQSLEQRVQPLPQKACGSWWS